MNMLQDGRGDFMSTFSQEQCLGYMISIKNSFVLSWSPGQYTYMHSISYNIIGFCSKGRWQSKWMPCVLLLELSTIRGNGIQSKFPSLLVQKQTHLLDVQQYMW